MNTQNGPINTSISKYPLWMTTVVAGIFSIAVNLLVLFVTKPLAPDFISLSVMPVVFWSIIAAVGAAIAFALARKYSKNPNRAFVRIAWIAFLLSFLMDIPLFFYDIEFFAGATTGGILALMAMHIVVFLIIAPLLVKFTRPRMIQPKIN